MEQIINRILKGEQDAKDILIRAKEEQKEIIKKAKEQREVVHKQMMDEAELKANEIVNEAKKRSQIIMDQYSNYHPEDFSYNEQAFSGIVEEIFELIWGINSDH